MEAELINRRPNRGITMTTSYTLSTSPTGEFIRNYQEHPEPVIEQLTRPIRSDYENNSLYRQAIMTFMYQREQQRIQRNT